MKKDNLHYNARKLDSYNKPFNFVISERESGKSANLIGTKIYKKWRHYKMPSLVLRRQIADITTTYIEDLCDSINTFLPKSQQIKFEYARGSIKDGVVDVKVNGTDFCRFIALSNPKGRIKSLKYNPWAIFFDEFIVDTRGGEKYLKDESNKFKEIYNTFNRFCVREYKKPIKCYFAGNPYSVFNPYFSWLNVDLTVVKPGSFLIGPNYVVECYQIKPELKEFILKNNPLYGDFDNAYMRYAFGGEAINDENMQIEPKQPDGYKLKWVFRIDHKYLGVFHKDTNRILPGLDYGKFWISVIDYVGDNRKIFAVDFDNLIDNSRLITTDIKIITRTLKDSIGNRDVTFQSVEAGYLTEAIYTVI